MSLRRSLAPLLHRLRLAAAEDGAALRQWQCRGHSGMAADVESLAAKFPKRRTPRPASGAASSEAAAAEQQAGAAAAAAAAAPEAGAAAAAAAGGPTPGSVQSLVGETQRESARVGK